MEKEMIFLIPHHPHSFVGKCWQSTMKVPDPYFSRCLCLHVNPTVPEAARLCPPRVSIVCCCSPPCTESTFPTPTFLLLILQIALPPGSLLSFSQLWDTIFLCAFKTLAILALKDYCLLAPLMRQACASWPGFNLQWLPLGPSHWPLSEYTSAGWRVSLEAEPRLLSTHPSGKRSLVCLFPDSSTAHSLQLN